ncbi:MAG: serine hydrolase [Verrucomicrobia bacterium]|nr:serine hydrolase [Verrucomicrobiota bacterium]
MAQEKVAQPTASKLKAMLADFDKYAAKARADWRIPGMAVGIVKDGKLIFGKGYGVKTQGGNDPVTENTLFQIGSTSKAFTSTLAAMLVDEGKVKWEDKVVDHVADFRMHDPWVTREFQVMDLMAQRSGMPAYAADTLFVLGFDRGYIKRAIRHIKPVSSFRGSFAYVNNLWLVAAGIVERYTGKTWEQALKERIFDPLGMTHSSADMQSFLNAGDVSSVHAAEGEKVVALPKNWEFLEWSYIAGPAGAINSNIKDMAKWLALQMNNGRVGEKQLVSEESMQMLHSPKTIANPIGDLHKNQFYCLGWIYKEHSPYPIIWHNGGTQMKTMLAYIPEQKIGVIVLSNYVTNLPELLAFRFFDQYAGKPSKDLSAEGLAEWKKKQKQEKAKKPVPPKNPLAAMPLENYAGVYANDVYGRISVSIVGGKLAVVIGPKKVKIILSHWDRDVFEAHWPMPDSDMETNFASFQASPEGRVTGITLDSLNQGDDMGVFSRVETATDGAKK